MQVVLPYRLSESDLSRQGRGVGDLHAVAGDQHPVFRPLPVSLVIDADDGDLIVGEKVTFDGFAEPEPVKHPAELGLSSIDAYSNSASSAAFNTRPVK